MKFKKLQLGILMCGFTAFTFAQDITTDLEVYYPLDGDGYSASDNDPDADLEGDVYEVDGFNGQAEGALHFDGLDDDRVSVVDADLGLPTGGDSRTIACWFRPDEETGNSELISYGTPGTDPKGAHQHFSYRKEDAVIRVGHWYADYDFPVDIVSGTWYHVAFTYDGSNFKFYFDGVLSGEAVAEADGQEPVNTILNGMFSMGARNLADKNDDPYTGDLDEVRVYSRALTDADIAALYEFEPEAPSVGVSASENNAITVYPNPVTELVNVDAKNIQLIQLINIEGKIIKEVYNSKSLNVSGVAPGVYSLKVNTSSKSMVNSIIVE